jgi:hypothetical protein
VVIPDIILADVSTDNALSRPYTIQERLLGQSLVAIWKTLTLAQKECAARIIINLTMLLQTIVNDMAGVITPASTFDNPGHMKTQKFIVAGMYSTK